LALARQSRSICRGVRDLTVPPMSTNPCRKATPIRLCWWSRMMMLFTTGYARNAIVHHGRLDPGVELIVKPFSYAALAAKLKTILEGK
jgi:hypothetical protein